MGLNSQIGRLGTLERHRATCDTFPDRAPSALSIPKNQIIQCRLPREIFTENQTRSYLETSRVMKKIQFQLKAKETFSRIKNKFLLKSAAKIIKLMKVIFRFSSNKKQKTNFYLD